MSQAANYTAQKIVVDGFDVLRLTDAAHKTEVSIAPAFGKVGLPSYKTIVAPTASVGPWVSPSFDRNCQSRRKNPAGASENPNRAPSWPVMMQMAMPLR